MQRLSPKKAEKIVNNSRSKQRWIQMLALALFATMAANLQQNLLASASRRGQAPQTGAQEGRSGIVEPAPESRSSSGAQQDTPLESSFDPGAIDLQQAITMAVANDPGYQQINWKIERAKGERFQATRYPNPSAGITANEIGNEGSGGQYGVFWSENIVRNNRLAVQQRYFSIAIAAMQQQYDIRRWQIVLNIGTRYLKASRFQREHEITSQQIESLKEILKVTQDLFDAGEISRIAVNNIELELNVLKQRLVELDLKQEFELRALAVPLGLAATQTNGVPGITLNWEPTIDELMNNESTSFDTAWLDNHPQVSFANAEVQQYRWKIELARADRCPDVNVQGSLNYDFGSDDMFAGFQVGVPILKYDRKDGAIKAANSEYQASMERVRLKEMQLQSTYTIREGELARLRSRVANIRDVIIPQALANLKQIREAFEIGEAEFLLLKTGFDQVLQSRIDLLDSEFKLATAAIELRTLLLDE